MRIARKRVSNPKMVVGSALFPLGEKVAERHPVVAAHPFERDFVAVEQLEPCWATDSEEVSGLLGG